MPWLITTQTRHCSGFFNRIVNVPPWQALLWNETLINAIEVPEGTKIDKNIPGRPKPSS